MSGAMFLPVLLRSIPDFDSRLPSRLHAGICLVIRWRESFAIATERVLPRLQQQEVLGGVFVFFIIFALL